MIKKIAAVIILVCVGGVIYYYASANKQLDVENILQNSSLKNRSFASKVVNIESNGVSAYLMEEHSAPIVSLSLAFKHSGWAYEDEKQAGISNILAAMLTSGAGEYSAEEFSDLCAEHGIHIEFTAQRDDITASMQMPAYDRELAVKLLKAVLYEPLLAENYLQINKEQTLTLLQLQKERPENVLKENFRHKMYGNHAYARQPLGNETSIAGLQAEDLRQYMEVKFTKNNLVVGIAGDISQAEAEDMLAELFALLPENENDDNLAVVKAPQYGTEYNVEMDTAQVVSHFAVPGTKRRNADFYALYLANYIFGGSGLNSRISQIIREKEGLTYGIYTYLSTADAAELLEGGFSATPENFVKAKKLLLQEWHKMAAEGVNEQELAEAKQALVASFNLRFDTVESIADMLVNIQEYNLGQDFLDKRNDYIQNVSLKEVNDAAKKYFRVEPLFVNVGINEKEKN
ncbi:MAG: insulinase family protein [Alphaproteobacteria bacterium]|nr:insulinase family protein [Alphaproteobacteria bacterium]